MDHFCYLCFVFVIHSCLFIVVLWSPTGLLCVMFYCVFVSFPCGVLGQVWCLICLLSYFVVTCWDRADLLALLYAMFSCVLSRFHVVSWVRCGT